MTALLTDNLPLLAGAPNGIKKLRELILELAVRGKLVEQDASDEPASELLKRIAEEKARLVAEGKIKKQKPLAEIDEEAEPSELPAGWKWSSLAQVAFVNPRNAAADSLEASFVPMTFIGTRFDAQHAQEPRLWGELKQGFTHFAEGDIGVAKITPCFENSKACVFSNLVNGLGAGTTELHIVRPVTGTLDPRYVLAYLKSPQFLLVGETKMTGTAGQKRLPKDFVEANPFPLPPLAEQHRIVTKVDELMALCDRLEAQQADAASAHAQLVQALLGSLTQTSDATEFAANWQRLAEHFHTLFSTEPSIDALKQTLLQLAVMGKLVPQDPSEESAIELLNRIQAEKQRLVAEGKLKKQKPPTEIAADEKFFELASGWQWARLLDCSMLITDGEHLTPQRTSDSSQVPLVTAKNVRDGFMDYGNTDYVERSIAEKCWGRCKPEVGDIMMVSVGATLGRLTVIREKMDMVIVRSVTLIRPLFVDADYLALMIRSPQLQSAIWAGVKQSAQPGLYLAQSSLLLMAVPPLPEQHRIVAKVDQLMALCDQLKTQLSQARQLNEQLASTLVEQAVA